MSETRQEQAGTNGSTGRSVPVPYTSEPPPIGAPAFPTLGTRSSRSIEPLTLGEAWEYANALCRASIVPDAYRGKPADVLFAILTGQEVGLSVTQSLQNIAVVNGRATLYGDAPLGIVRARIWHEIEKFEEKWEPDVEGGRWTTTVKRKGMEEVVRSFSMDEAKKIKCSTRNGTIMLAEKDTYRNYPRRMCKFKARNEALRDTCADVLLGLTTFEDATENVIEAEVIGSETLTNEEALANRLQNIGDPQVMQSLLDGFNLLNMSPAARLAKMRAYDGRERELVDVLRNEYTQRKSSGTKKFDPNAPALAAAPAAAPAPPAPAEEVAESNPSETPEAGATDEGALDSVVAKGLKF